MAYDRSSINKFVQNQGGSLSNLGASPTYTGAAKPEMNPALRHSQYVNAGRNQPAPQTGSTPSWWAQQRAQQGGGSPVQLAAQRRALESRGQQPLGWAPNDPNQPAGPVSPLSDPSRLYAGPWPQPDRPIDRFSPGGPVDRVPPWMTNPQSTTLGSLGQQNQQTQYQNAVRNMIMQQRIQMMMQQRGMGNLNRLGVR